MANPEPKRRTLHKLTMKQKEEIRARYKRHLANYASMTLMAKEYGVPPQVIFHAIHGVWRFSKK